MGTIFGGCNISGTVGEVATGENTAAGDTAYVVLRGGTVCDNVFGGGNGYYGCRNVENSQLVYFPTMLSGYDYLAEQNVPVPITYNSYVIINTTDPRDVAGAPTGSGVTVKGNVYGAGNMSPQGTLETDGSDIFHSIVPQRMGRVLIDAIKGTVNGDIYGGGRSSDVHGISSIYITSANMGEMTINGRVFGGNDIAGRVTGVTGTGGAANMRWATSLDGTTLSDANAASYIRVEGMPYVNEVYGGGNGEAYASAQFCECTGEGGNWSTTAPMQTAAWVDVNMSCSGVATLGTINTLYGGGNAADVGKATTYITGTGYIDVAFAGGNGADVTNSSPTLTVNTPTEMRW